jgi:hypothetical protein
MGDAPHVAVRGVLHSVGGARIGDVRAVVKLDVDQCRALACALYDQVWITTSDPEGRDEAEPRQEGAVLHRGHIGTLYERARRLHAPFPSPATPEEWLANIEHLQTFATTFCEEHGLDPARWALPVIVKASQLDPQTWNPTTRRYLDPRATPRGKR